MKSVGGREENLLRKARSIRAKRGRATLKNSPSPHAPHLLSPNLFNLGYVPCRRHESHSPVGTPEQGKGVFIVQIARPAVRCYFFFVAKGRSVRVKKRLLVSANFICPPHTLAPPQGKPSLLRTRGPKNGGQGGVPPCGVSRGAAPLWRGPGQSPGRRRHIFRRPTSP